MQSSLERFVRLCSFQQSNDSSQLVITIISTCHCVNTIRYDSVCLTCSKKLMGSQLSLSRGTNKKLKCKTKNKMMSMIGPVQSRKEHICY